MSAAAPRRSELKRPFASCSRRERARRLNQYLWRIVRCDMVARGVVGAVQKLGIDVPVVVRLEGTNVKKAASDSRIWIELYGCERDAGRR